MLQFTNQDVISCCMADMDFSKYQCHNAPYQQLTAGPFPAHNLGLSRFMELVLN